MTMSTLANELDSCTFWRFVDKSTLPWQPHLTALSVPPVEQNRNFSLLVLGCQTGTGSLPQKGKSNHPLEWTLQPPPPFQEDGIIWQQKQFWNTKENKLSRVYFLCRHLFQTCFVCNHIVVVDLLTVSSDRESLFQVLWIPHHSLQTSSAQVQPEVRDSRSLPWQLMFAPQHLLQKLPCSLAVLFLQPCVLLDSPDSLQWPTTSRCTVDASFCCLQNEGFLRLHRHLLRCLIFRLPMQLAKSSLIVIREVWYLDLWIVKIC